MKKQLITVLALAGIAAGATLAFAAEGSHGGGILKSKHDMNMYVGSHGGKLDKDQRVCAYCHTPHHSVGIGATAMVDIDKDGAADLDGLGNETFYEVYYPLWSRALNPTATIDGYVSQTFNPTGKFYDPLAGPSRLCMTCHDGTIAADSYYGETNGSANAGDDQLVMWSMGNFGIGKGDSLSNDHPVGFVYKDMADDDTKYEIKDQSSTFIGTQKTIDSALTDIAGVGKVMTCASCHDVHNGNAVQNKPLAAGESGRGYFLLAAQKDSAICLSCHDK